MGEFHPPESDDKKPRIKVRPCEGCGRDVAGHPGSDLCILNALRAYKSEVTRLTEWQETVTPRLAKLDAIERAVAAGQSYPTTTGGAFRERALAGKRQA